MNDYNDLIHMAELAEALLIQRDDATVQAFHEALNELPDDANERLQVLEIAPSATVKRSLATTNAVQTIRAESSLAMVFLHPRPQQNGVILSGALNFYPTVSPDERQTWVGGEVEVYQGDEMVASGVINPPQNNKFEFECTPALMAEAVEIRFFSTQAQALILPNVRIV